MVFQVCRVLTIFWFNNLHVLWLLSRLFPFNLIEAEAFSNPDPDPDPTVAACARKEEACFYKLLIISS